MRNRVDTNEETRSAIADLLCDELEKGISIKVACDLVGITDAAYHRWKKRAEAGDEEAIGLMRRLATARARGFEQHIGKIKATADQADDWRARAWLVDKLYPGWGGDKAGVEEIAFKPAERDDPLTQAYMEPTRLVELVKTVIATGLVTIEELTAIAPKQPRPDAQPSSELAAPVADQMKEIRAAVVYALSKGPLEPTELRDNVCQAFGCSHEQFEQAISDLAGEQDADQAGGQPGQSSAQNSGRRDSRG